MKRTSGTLLALALLSLLTLSYALECYQYQVVTSNGLTQNAINYLASITVEACEQTSDPADLATNLRKSASAIYGCPSCVSVLVSGTESGTTTAQQLIADWYLVVQTGDYLVSQFVGKDCVSYGFDESRFLATHSEAEQPLSHRFTPSTESDASVACSCSTFSWDSSSGLSSSQKSQLESAAKSACNSASSISGYVSTLYSKLYSNFAYADVIASTSVTGGFSVSNLWYGAFSVGCYETVALHNPEACDGYKPPKTFPTPTAIVAYSPSPSSSLVPSITPTRSLSISVTPAASTTRSITPTISLTTSITPSPSFSPAVSGCGSPPCSGHGRCNNGVCTCNSFYHGPQCQYEYCPGNCSYVGTCDPNTGECSCNYPFYGCDCSSILYNCTCEHGTCNQLNGLCTCDVGWTGLTCNVSSACANNCNNKGRCTINETCECFPGWTGTDCDTRDLNCSQGCQNGGYCNNQTGTCSCPAPYFGPSCTYLNCGNGGTNLTCSGNGKCNYNTGSCYCNAGFSGCFCTVWTGAGSPPPPKSPPTLPTYLQCGTGGSNATCSGHGQCNHATGSCYCDAGWQGCYCNQYVPSKRR